MGKLVFFSNRHIIIYVIFLSLKLSWFYFLFSWQNCCSLEPRKDVFNFFFFNALSKTYWINSKDEENFNVLERPTVDRHFMWYSNVQKKSFIALGSFRWFFRTWDMIRGEIRKMHILYALKRKRNGTFRPLFFFFVITTRSINLLLFRCNFS